MNCSVSWSVGYLPKNWPIVLWAYIKLFLPGAVSIYSLLLPDPPLCLPSLPPPNGIWGGGGYGIIRSITGWEICWLGVICPINYWAQFHLPVVHLPPSSSSFSLPCLLACLLSFCIMTCICKYDLRSDGSFVTS